MTKRKELGEFHRGALVCITAYGMGGSIRRVYGKVTRVDVKNKKVHWRPLEKHYENTIDYPPPAPEEPSSWKFYVVTRKDIPEDLRQYL